MPNRTPSAARTRSLAVRARHLMALTRELQADVTEHTDRRIGRYAADAAVALADLLEQLEPLADRPADG